MVFKFSHLPNNLLKLFIPTDLGIIVAVVMVAEITPTGIKEKITPTVIKEVTKLILVGLLIKMLFLVLAIGVGLVVSSLSALIVILLP